jgi:CMP-N-acetylneuraminic acid synthetase
MGLLAIVPARGGSKRLPGKNIAKLLGKPLIHYTLDAVYGTAEKIIVTSDSDEILQAATEHQSNPQCLLRESRLAGDKSTVLDTVVDIVCTKELASNYDSVGLFLPTAPLRSTRDVIKAYNELDNTVDGVISCCDYEFPPALGLVMDPDGLLHCANPSLPFITGNTRSQDHTSIIRPNGAIYLKWRKSFFRDKNFFKGRIKAYKMPRERSIDIDTNLDLKVAEYIINGQAE